MQAVPPPVSKGCHERIRKWGTIRSPRAWQVAEPWPVTTSRANWQLHQLGSLRVMKRILNLAVLAAATAVAITLVASRRERRPTPEAGTWVPEDRDD